MSHAQFTRRDVLKGAAGTLAAVPYFWTSARAVAESANDKLTVAAVGVGGRGTDIGRQAAGLGNMVACADVYRTNAE
ncbi:MAG: gfo/Idh/MocA family oxidoreductase, partial [Phycisphaerae bacterium]|nr:gfo/Idh/MocA family oxidoreductase [Phycisphaerae bacterium]